MRTCLSRFVPLCLLVGVSLLVATSAIAQDGQQLPPLSDLEEGWNFLETGGETTCAFGDPFGFFVRPGRLDSLVVTFGGGHVCWDDSCLENRALQRVDENVLFGVWLNDGLFKFDDPANPLADYTMVVIPHCTGDSHLGRNVVWYGEGKRATEFAHYGFTNARAALQYVYANIPEPERIVVLGLSGGVPGSVVFTPSIIERYRETFLFQLGDSLGAFNTDSDTFVAWRTAEVLPEWMAGGSAEMPEALTFQALYTAVAENYPDYVFAQSNSAFDTNLMAITSEFYEVLRDNMQEIAEAAPNFRYFIAGGQVHALTANQVFYTIRVGDVAFKDWFSDLLNGEDVQNVECEQCARADVGQD